MPKLFFASDTHFSHPNILKYEPKRLEATIEFMLKLKGIHYDSEVFDETLLVAKEILNGPKDSSGMNELLFFHNTMLLERWNAVVSEEDTVIFLGDFAYCHKACKRDNNWNKIDAETKASIAALAENLNGHKIMIMGNHDWRGEYFQGPMKGMYYVKPEIEQFWRDCGFEAVYPNAQILKGFFECSHEPNEYYSPSMARYNIYGHVHSDARFTTETEQSFCACIDRHNFAPVELKVFNEFEK